MRQAMVGRPAATFAASTRETFVRCSVPTCTAGGEFNVTMWRLVKGTPHRVRTYRCGEHVPAGAVRVA